MHKTPPLLLLPFLHACSCGEDPRDSTAPDDSPPADSEPTDSEPPDSEPPDSEPPDSEPPDSEPPGDSAQDTGQSLCDEMPKGQVSLPADDGEHDDPVEWWYWTGHLQTPEGRWFGFEQVVFLFEYAGYTGIMAHHGLTDPDGDDFSYAVHYGLYGGEAVQDGFDFSIGGLSMVGGDGVDQLHGELERSTLDLTLSSTKAPVLQHGDGYQAYDFGGYTYYYSRTRMDAQGTLVLDGESLSVSGQAWFDHQWGELDQAVTRGWDWFAVQLDDGSDLMLFLIRGEDEDLLVGATLSDAQCRITEYEASEVSVTSQRSWTSPATGCTWPIGWELQVGDLTLQLEPVLDDQEVPNMATDYWEGACTVTGDATGRAYVELTGYCG